jgi:hypothetical protein
MKNLVIALGLIIATVVVANAQNSETRSLGNFDQISVAESINVTLKRGDKNEAIIETSGVDVEDVLTEISGSTLRIHMKKGNYFSRNVDITSTYTTLTGAKVSSSGSIEGDDVIATERFDVRASSSGYVSLVLNVRKLDASASSSGKVTLAGKAKFQDLHVSSSGKIDAFDLDSEEADVHVSSSGKAKINVHNMIDAHASSSGKVYYRGNPDKVYVDSSSSGKVIKD